MNVIWATGGGAVNIIFERLGGIYFAEREHWNPDLAVGCSVDGDGLGLTLGMLIAHRTSIHLDRSGRHSAFIGWTLIAHGCIFSFAGIDARFCGCLPSDVRFAGDRRGRIRDTGNAFQRSLPDHIRGRISTLDRGAELTMFGLSSYFASEAMYYISPMTLTVISGILSASSGVVWFWRSGPRLR